MAATKYTRFEIEPKLIGNWPDDILWEGRKAQFSPVSHTIDEIMAETVTGRTAPADPSFVEVETNIVFDTGGDGGLLVIRNLSPSVTLQYSADFGGGARETRQIKPNKFQIVDYFNGSSNNPRIAGIGASCPFALWITSTP